MMAMCTRRSSTAQAAPALVLLCVLALALASCAVPGSNTTATGGDATAGKLDACTLMTKADVAAIMGQPYQDGVPGLQNDGSGGTAAFSECRFAQVSDQLTEVRVFVRRSPVDDNTPAAIDQDRQSMRENFNATVRDVSGIGDVAFWAVYPSGKQLHVFKGGNLYLFVTLSSTLPDNDATIAKAKALAQKTLDQLTR
jgi:hypothetical protein